MTCPRSPSAADRPSVPGTPPRVLLKTSEHPRLHHRPHHTILHQSATSVAQSLHLDLLVSMASSMASASMYIIDPHLPSMSVQVL